MDSHQRRYGRNWNVLCWNIRGINATNKLTAQRSKIKESNCDIICIQETKRETFDQAYLRNLCPSQFDCFDYIPSLGLSGGMITIWKGSKFNGQVVFQNEFALSIEFSSMFSDHSWILTQIYAPCTTEAKLYGLVL
jgi:exonuclease III